ncbi:hypothetical protein ACFU67_13430 [Streptomyces rhizosphaericola]|uniref:hypothetical protein n=1 Tax=Streptomyces rhizosphaericola TaxID=2564098 RepID=UPI00369F9A91
MSITLIPRSKSNPKPHRKHRLATRMELKRQLRDQQEQTSQAFGQLIGAGDAIAALEERLGDERAGRVGAERVARCLAADLDERTGERDQARAEVAALRARLAPFLAAEANANAVTVPSTMRDTTAFEDQATEPINVRPLWEAIGPVVRTDGSADPAHLPTT